MVTGNQTTVERQPLPTAPSRRYRARSLMDAAGERLRTLPLGARLRGWGRAAYHAAWMLLLVHGLECRIRITIVHACMRLLSCDQRCADGQQYRDRGCRYEQPTAKPWMRQYLQLSLKYQPRKQTQRDPKQDSEQRHA